VRFFTLQLLDEVFVIYTKQFLTLLRDLYGLRDLVSLLFGQFLKLLNTYLVVLQQLIVIEAFARTMRTSAQAAAI
jgi:hypothetical protein